MPVVLWAGSLSLVAIFDRQVDLGWFLFSPPGLLSFVIFTISNIAELNRAPFDLPEAESEIIAGFHTEYSGMRWSLFFLGEYLGIFALGGLGTALFLGGGTLPFVGGFQVRAFGTSTWFSFLATNASLVTVFSVKLMAYIFFYLLGPGDAPPAPGRSPDGFRLEVPGAAQPGQHPDRRRLVRAGDPPGQPSVGGRLAGHELAGGRVGRRRGVRDQPGDGEARSGELRASMLKKIVGTVVVFQCGALLAAGILTFLYSQSLMTWLIHLVGEEWALGRDNVIRQPNGGLLLTNPGAMALWATPFLLLAMVEVSSSFTLAWLRYRHLKTR